MAEQEPKRAIFTLELTDEMRLARKTRDTLASCNPRLPEIMSEDEMMAACLERFRCKNPDVKDVLVIFLDNTDGKADFTVKTKGETRPMIQMTCEVEEQDGNEIKKLKILSFDFIPAKEGG